MPPHLKKSNNQAPLENGTYEQIVSHLQIELELNGLEAPDELQVNTVTQQATQQKREEPKPTCHHSKKPGHYRNQCHQLEREKDEAQNITNSAGSINNNNGGQTNSNSDNETSNKTNTNNRKQPK